MKSRWIGWSAALGAGALMFLVGGATPAQAQGRYDGGRDWAQSRDLRNDYNRLNDLERARDRAVRRHDWREVHNLDARINDLRRHIDRDRRDIRRDDRRDNRDNRDWRSDRNRRDWNWR